MKKVFLLALSCLVLGACQQQLPETETIATPLIIKKKKKSIEEKARTVAERQAYEFQLARNPLTNEIPEGIRQQETLAAAQVPEFNSDVLNLTGNGTTTVIPRGPNNLGGRTRAVNFDVRNPAIMLAGGVSSGVFRSTNAGTSWTRVSPNDEMHNVTTIVQDTRAGQEDTWYYGTGEAVGNSASANGATYLGNGVWKSTDNGVSWNVLPNTAGPANLFTSAFNFVHRLAVDPTNGDIYAAASDVIMRSTNGGANWATVLGALGSSRNVDIDITPTGRLYAAFRGTDGSEGVWTSTMGTGGSWTQIAGGGAATTHPNWNAPGTYGRVVIKHAPSNPNILFALYFNGAASSCAGTAVADAELYRWDQSTTTWTDLSANMPDEAGCSDGNDPFAAQGGYNLAIGVKPDDVNTVFIGGTNIYRSTDGFTTINNTTRIGGYNSPASYALYPNHHPDIHHLTFAPNDNNTLYSGTDGGVHRADIRPASVSWTSLNNDYVTYQYYHIDIAPTATIDGMIGGAQDNGTTEVLAGDDHNPVFGGDGCGVGIIEYTNSGTNNMIVSAQGGFLVRAIDNVPFHSISPSVATNKSIFVTYFHVDQDNTDYLYYANGNDLIRTRTASTLTNGTVTGNSSTGWETMTGSSMGSNIRALATTRNASLCDPYAVSNTDRKLLIGTEGGSIFRLDDPAFCAANSAPTNITPAGAGGGATVLGLAINPENPDEAMAVYSNYGVASIFHTTDVNAATPTWTNIEGPGGGAVELASVRSCAIASDGATTLYIVGTSTGVYCTDTPAGAATVWAKIGTNSIGMAVASSMRYRPWDYQLGVGTHGNGMFQLDLTDHFNLQAQVSIRVNVAAAYNGTDMNTDLANSSLVPTLEPYTAISGFTHVGGGGETTTAAIINDNDIVDWVYVELRDKTNSSTVLATRAALLKKDGTVVSHLDGKCPVTFTVAPDDYFVAVRYRYHLGVMAANLVTVTAF